MGVTIPYPIDLRVKVLAEYKAGVVGYKTLAVRIKAQAALGARGEKNLTFE